MRSFNPFRLRPASNRRSGRRPCVPLSRLPMRILGENPHFVRIFRVAFLRR